MIKLKQRNMTKALFYSVLVFFCSSTFLATQVRADLIVNLQNIHIAAGETGYVDVFVESTNAGNLDAFQYKFEIVDAASNVGDLRFTSPQLSTELSESNYVHAGDSGGFISVSQNTPAFDEILGGDFTDSFSGTNLTVARLLVRLDVEHILPQGTPLEAADGDSFIIRLVEDSDTFFLSNNFDNIAIESSDGGEVLVVAVPEPTSLLVMILAGVGCMTVRRKSLWSLTS